MDVYSVAAPPSRLRSVGACLMPSTDLLSSLGIGDDVWRRFRSHWDELPTDHYADELGTQRLRRYGLYSLANETATPVPAAAFVQPEDSNPLYLQTDRLFEPLTNDPLLHKLLLLLAQFAAVLDDIPEWTVKVHPFRVVASADGTGQPTPEGVHRDGVTLVTSLLIARRNAVGGESSVFRPCRSPAAHRHAVRARLTADRRRPPHCARRLADPQPGRIGSCST